MLEFLKGKYQPEIDRLTDRMMSASEEMNFEEAARCRDLIESIRQIGEKQKITGSDSDDRDIIAIAMDSAQAENDPELAFTRNAVVSVFFVRGGRLIGREHFLLNPGDTDEPAEVLSALAAGQLADSKTGGEGLDPDSAERNEGEARPDGEGERGDSAPA